MSPLPSHSDFTEILTSLSNLLLPYTLSCILIPMVFSFVPRFLLFFSLTVCIATCSGVRFLRKANVVVRR
jgi:hypothetical protein